MPDLAETGETARKFIKNEARNHTLFPAPFVVLKQMGYI
jgi:hypothetical protein